MKRMLLKWLAGICLGVILMVFAAIGAAGFLAGTPSGLRMALDLGRDSIPGELSVDEINGGLLGHLVLKGISYGQDNFSVNIGKVVLAWAPAGLLDRIFHLKELKIEDVRYVQIREGKSQPAEKGSSPLVLPDITLPIAILLDDVRINTVHVLQKPGATPLDINRIALSASLDRSGLALSVFEFLMPDAAFHLRGKLDPRGVYPMDFSMDWNAAVSGGAAVAVNGTGTVSGDMKLLTLGQSVRGDMHADLKAHVMDLPGHIQWDAALVLKDVSRRLLASVNAVSDLQRMHVGCSLDAEGDLEQVKVAVNTRISPVLNGDDSSCPDAINREEVCEQGPAAGSENKLADMMTLDIRSDIRLKTMEFNASGEWENLHWPLAGPAEYASEKGEFAARGTPGDYEFSFDTGVHGRAIPEVQMEAACRGSEEKIDLERFHAALLGGSLDVQVRAAWQPSVSWQAMVSARDINPGLLVPEWPGNINVELDTHGKLEGRRPDLEVNIQKIYGTLREKKISGTGQVMMADGNITIGSMNLGCGSAGVDVQGVLGSRWDLAWNASVPDASELLPHGTGSISSSGRLSGTSSSPAVAGTVAVRDFTYNGAECRRLDTDFSLFRDESKSSSLKLGAWGLASGGQEISKVSVDLRGTLSSHALEVSAVHEAVTLHLDAEDGSYDMNKKRWNGVMDTLGLDTKDFGAWELAEPVRLAVSPDDADMSRLCLRDSGASVCMKAHWLKHGDGRATASVRGISLERAMQFLPPEITGLSGMVSADVDAVLGARPLLDFALSISPGAMTFMLDQARQVRISHRGGVINAVLGQEQLSADLKLAMGENGVSANVNIPRGPLEKDPHNAPFTGTVNLDVRELGLVTAFVPAVKDTDGQVTAGLKLGGTIGDPRVDGDVKVNISGPHVPVLGLDLDETVFNIAAHSATGLDINGHLKSGKNSVAVTGNVILDAARGWPAHIELTGSNFKVLDIPDAMVRLSPHIKLDYSGADGLMVRGTVAVPDARITPREIPAGVEKPSEDVVMVSTEKPHGKKSGGLPVDADVTLELLDNVHVMGFGLDCYIKGSLAIVMLPGKKPAAHGELRITQGTFRFYGHDLTIEKGIISYAGGRVDNPGVNLLAVRDVGGIPVGVKVTGYVTDLDVSGYSSDPSVSSPDAITMLITGKSKNDPGFSEAAANTAAIAGADMVAQQLKGYTGLDHLDVKGTGENSSDTTVFAGKDITEDLTVGVEAGTDDDGTQFVVRYNLWHDLDLQVKSGSSRSGMNLLYTIEFR